MRGLGVDREGQKGAATENLPGNPALSHVVQFSTGAGSAEVAWRVVEKYGVDSVVLLTADTMAEDADNWRFAREVVDALRNPEWVRLADGRTPMQVGLDLKVVPNNRMAVCSRVLKRELLRPYIEDRFDPETTVVYLGFDWTEMHRLDAAVPHWAPWTISAPLCERPYLSKPDLLGLFRQRGIEPPRLYSQGFTHANCGGACVRGGQAQWANLLRVNRPRYMDWEADEQRIRDSLGKNVTILRDRTAKTGASATRPLSLAQFRARLDSQPSMFDPDDWGACGCTESA